MKPSLYQDYPASLMLGKLYQIIPDEAAESHGYIRVIDEGGEDYGYSTDRFFPSRFPLRCRKLC